MSSRVRLSILLGGILLIAACSDIQLDEPEGSEGAKCYPNGTCQPGLTCVSNICVADGSDVMGGDTTPGEDTSLDTATDTAPLDTSPDTAEIGVDTPTDTPQAEVTDTVPSEVEDTTPPEVSDMPADTPGEMAQDTAPGDGTGETTPDDTVSDTPGEVCTPTTCVDLGYGCGAADDGCGGVLDCGACGSDTEVCDAASHVCVCAYEQCGDTCCADGEVCLEGSCTLETCVDDMMGVPTFDDQAIVALSIPTTIEALALCTDQGEDWFMFALDQERELAINVASTADGLLGFGAALYADGFSGTTDTLTTDSGDDVYLMPGVLQPGDYYLRVYAPTGEGSYTLTIEDVPECIEDMTGVPTYDDMAIQTLTFPAEILDLSVCTSGAQDWFTFTLDQELEVEFCVETDIGTGLETIDLALYTEEMVADATDEVFLTWGHDFCYSTLLAPGVYYLEAFQYSSHGYYDLYVHEAPPCMDDGVSVQAWDDPAISQLLSPSVYPELALCGDHDWFTFELADPRQVLATAMAKSGFPTLNMYLYSDASPLEPVEVWGTYGESVTYEGLLTEGLYYLEVFHYQDMEGTYSLSFETSGPCNDDTVGVPTADDGSLFGIQPDWTSESLAVCTPSTSDWFGLDLAVASEVVVTAVGSDDIDGLSSFVLRLHQDAGDGTTTELASAQGEPDASLSMLLLEGSYLVEIGAGLDVGQYTLEVTATPAAAPANDTCATAQVIDALPYSTTGDTTLATDDYSFPVDACSNQVADLGLDSGDLVYQLVPDHDGEYYIGLSSPSSTFLATLAVVTDCADPTSCVWIFGGNGTTAYLLVTLAQGDTYYVIVDGHDGTAGSFELTVTDYENIVPNGDFEEWTGTPLFPEPWNAEIGVGVEQETAIVHTGTSAAKLTRTSEVNGETQITSGLIPVVPMASYLISMWFYDDSVDARGRLIYAWYDSTMTMIGTQSYGSYTSNAPEWLEYTQDVTAPDNAAFLTIATRVYADAGLPTGGIIYLDTVSVSPQ